MSNVNAAAEADSTAVLRMLQASKAAGAAGHGNEADQLLARAAQMAPGHPAVLNELGLRMMQRGDAAKARELFERATQADGGHPQLWSNLAASLKALGQEQAEMDAIERALALDPRFTIRRFRDATNARSDNPIYIAGRERLIEGMRLAGVPEG